jgi:hypothetical protein
VRDPKLRRGSLKPMLERVIDVLLA